MKSCMRRIVLMLLFSAILLLDQASASETISRTFYNTSADSYIHIPTIIVNPDGNHGDEDHLDLNPCGPLSCVLSLLGSKKRILVNFDISTIPDNSPVTSATLSLYLNSASGGSLIQEVHRVTNSWTETGVTWYYRYGSTYWNPYGGEFDSISTDSLTITTTAGWKSWTVTSDVSDFVANTYTNYGWIILRDDDTLNQNFVYASSRNTNTTRRPKLSVSFSAPWESYNDSGRTNPTTNFANNDHIVYMKGTGFANGNYNVAYYDNDGYIMFSEDNIAVTNGILNSSYTLTANQTSVPGTWHAIAQPASGYAAFPNTYSTATGSPDTYGLIANDAFTVQKEPIPEYPAGIVIPFTASFIMYMCMRNRVRNGKK